MFPSVFLVCFVRCAYFQGFLSSLLHSACWGSGDLFPCEAFADFPAYSFLRCSSWGNHLPPFAACSAAIAFLSFTWTFPHSLSLPRWIVQILLSAGSGEEQFAGKWWSVWEGSCSTLQVLDPLAHTKPSHWFPLNAVLQLLSFSSGW